MRSHVTELEVEVGNRKEEDGRFSKRHAIASAERNRGLRRRPNRLVRDRHRFVEFFLEVLWELLVILYQEYMFETYVTVLQQSDWFPDSPLMQIVLVVVPFALSLVVVQ
ncbi:hypothetical protein V5799_014637 [Amblyomma americanum]|uniref:Uncharacterized protein n=1 Tax=Amblyomma americanum TaxID=6943 RepID=A0AAQ4E2F7_AMBAM